MYLPEDDQFLAVVGAIGVARAGEEIALDEARLDPREGNA